MRLDYVLALKVEDFLERRLQTQVFKSGLAKSIHHARVLIRQRHIRVGKQVVNVPSFVVRLDSQKHSECRFWVPGCGGPRADSPFSQSTLLSPRLTVEDVPVVSSASERRHNKLDPEMLEMMRTKSDRLAFCSVSTYTRVCNYQGVVLQHTICARAYTGLCSMHNRACGQLQHTGRGKTMRSTGECRIEAQSRCRC